MPKRTDYRGILLLAIGAAVVALDQYTKHLVRQAIPQNTSREPIPALGRFLTFTHVSNTGAAFGLFRDWSLVFIGVAVVVIVLILVYHRQLSGASWLLRVAFGLQLGGATGNLIDRLTQSGHVTDFIDVRIWPVFNVADSSVVVGTVLLGIFAFFLDRPEQDEEGLRGEVTLPPKVAEPGD